MNTNLFLHIGTHKTGTTSLQYFCHDNKEKLKELGFLYPETGCIWKGHHELAWALGIDHPKKRSDISDDELWDSLAKEASESCLGNIILSSEDFEWCTRELARLKHYVKDFNVKIIVYIRRQDNYLLSFYSTHVKDFRPRTSKTITEYINTFNLDTLNYHDYLGKWSAVFGSENIIVRVFEKSQLPDGLIADFLSVLGIPTLDGFTLDKSHKSSNKSLHPECLEFLRICNKIDLTEEKHIALRKVATQISDILQESEEGRARQLLSPEKRLEIINKYDSQNINVAKYFLNRPDGRLFYDEPPDVENKWIENNQVSMETLVMALAKLWNTSN